MTRTIFSWGVENELIKAPVADALKHAKGLRYGKTAAPDHAPVSCVSDAVVDAKLPYLTPQVRAMVELQRLTGMRSGEVNIMRTSDINTQGTVWTYTPSRHTNTHRGQGRVVYLGPRAQELLRPWLRTNLNEYLFQPREAEQWRRQKRHAARRTPIGYGNRPGSNRSGKPRKTAGERYTSGSYRSSIEAGCELAFGMPAELRRRAKGETLDERQQRYTLASKWRAKHCWHPHQLRHNYATMTKRAHGIESARILLGHASKWQSEQYAEPDRLQAIAVAAKIG